MAVKKNAGSGVSKIIDTDVADEMRDSFLEYAYSVIYSRALPDARDGLKPVQRRILFQMNQMTLITEVVRMVMMMHRLAVQIPCDSM